MKMADDEVQQERQGEQDASPKQKEPLIPLATIKRIMKTQGVEKITTTALIEVRQVVGDIIKEMARNVVVYTKHRKAKISSKEDVLLAIR
jgi:histone H3/H4